MSGLIEMEFDGFCEGFELRELADVGICCVSIGDVGNIFLDGDAESGLPSKLYSPKFQLLPILILKLHIRSPF